MDPIHGDDPLQDVSQATQEPSSEGLISAPESTPAETPHDFVRIRRSHLYSVLVPLAFVTGLAVGFLFWGRAKTVPVTSPTVDETASQEPIRVSVSLDDDPSFGPPTAPITIVEFSDFNCPYCKKWQAETFYPLMAAYPDQIHFVYRDFPITSQESFVAAQAANCAAEQIDYWDYHDALMTGDLGLGREAYTQYADLLGMDQMELLACIDSKRYAGEVEADARYAASLGVSGTPTFFINGIPLVGAQPLAQFSQIIDAELR